MSDNSIIADCCGACFGICFLTCCESVLVALNFKKPGPSSVSTQRGCCRNWGESTEDDVFEENARRERVAGSSNKNQSGGEDQNGKESEREGGGNEPVTEQPVAPPPMTPAATTTATEPDVDEAK